ncbi:hypothetical protein ES708_21070 [subsurface metagenome]
MFLRHPLGKTGGAGGKHEHGYVFVLNLGKGFVLRGAGFEQLVVVHHPLPLSPNTNKVLHRRQLELNATHHVGITAADEEDAGLGFVHQIGQLVLPHPEVQGDEDSPQLDGGETGFDILVTVDLDNSGTVALL